jgi:hypothetical protein
MSTSTNNVTLTIIQYDGSGVNLLGSSSGNGRTVGPLSLAGTAGQYTQALNVGVGSTVLSLPVSPTVNVYIKNLHATQTVTITATPNGGGGAIIGTLGPGELFLWWGIAQARGFTAISLTASGANTPVEMFLGG